MQNTQEGKCNKCKYGCQMTGDSPCQCECHTVTQNKEGRFEELMSLIDEGHEAVINHEEVAVYQSKVKAFLAQVEKEAFIKAAKVVKSYKQDGDPEDRLKLETFNFALNEIAGKILSLNENKGTK